MRRFAAVQKARDADVFGILVGTLGVGQYSSSMITLSSPTSDSVLFTSHITSSQDSCKSAKEELYDQCRQAQPCKTGELYGDRVLRFGGLSGEQRH